MIKVVTEGDYLMSGALGLGLFLLDLFFRLSYGHYGRKALFYVWYFRCNRQLE